MISWEVSMCQLIQISPINTNMLVSKKVPKNTLSNIYDT